jgi:hypothetical protein
MRIEFCKIAQQVTLVQSLDRVKESLPPSDHSACGEVQQQQQQQLDTAFEKTYFLLPIKCMF